LRRHARKVRQVYEGRRSRFAESLQRHIGEWVQYEIPDGGLAFWLWFTDPERLERLEARAPGMGLRFASSRSFMTSDKAPRGLRFGFASLTPDEADRALATLRQAAL
jgi:GntR family transcriptional regulator/MocR family aminotransferase